MSFGRILQRMKSPFGLPMILPLLPLLACTALADVAGTNKAVSLSGTFSWAGRKEAKPNETLVAVLTPSGSNVWKAVFTFTWSKVSHTWDGTVKGHLDSGEISGEAADERGKRAFRLQGRAINHVLTFNHFETTGGKSTATGVGTLRPGGSSQP